LPNTKDVLFFGHFNYPPNEFGITRFLREGWPRLAASSPRARMILAGKDMPPALAREADNHERVVRLGFVPDLKSLLEQSRIVLVPLWHGGGTRLKVLEALASARPLVGTPRSVEEIGVVDGRHGALADAPLALAAAAGSCSRIPSSLEHSRAKGGHSRSASAGGMSWGPPRRSIVAGCRRIRFSSAYSS
jgi:glycosyltransferase involved in cell wall biosynthesis